MDGPLVVLFEEQCADEAQDGVVVWEDADDVGAALNLAIQPLDRVRNRYEDLGAEVLAAVVVIVAYGVAIRDRGTGSTMARAGRCIP